MLGTAWPQHMNKPIAETMFENIRSVGLPKWSEADQTLAKALQKELRQPEQNGLATRAGERSAGRCRKRTSAAAARTTSATSRGTCRR